METVEEVLREADVVSLHCNLDANTVHLMNKERLNMMKVRLDHPYMRESNILYNVIGLTGRNSNDWFCGNESDNTCIVCGICGRIAIEV